MSVNFEKSLSLFLSLTRTSFVKRLSLHRERERQRERHTEKETETNSEKQRERERQKRHRKIEKPTRKKERVFLILLRNTLKKYILQYIFWFSVRYL